MQTPGSTQTKPIWWEYTRSVQICVCINTGDVYQGSQSLLVEVFCYAHRDTGLKFLWTSAESHPQLTTRMLCPDHVNVTAAWGRSKALTLENQSPSAQSMLNCFCCIKDACCSPPLPQVWSAPACLVLLR